MIMSLAKSLTNHSGGRNLFLASIPFIMMVVGSVHNRVQNDSETFVSQPNPEDNEAKKIVPRQNKI